MTVDNSIKELINQAKNTRHIIAEILDAYMLDSADGLEIIIKLKNGKRN